MRATIVSTTIGAALALFGLISTTNAGTLSCTVATTCAGGTVIFRMASTANSHAEMPSQSNYTQLVCCSGVTALGTSCSGTYATAVKLSALTNAHAEQGTQSNYANSACVSVPSGASVSIGYQATNCTGYDTTLGSMSDTTNAHVGDSAAFSTKICGTAADAPPQTLTFSLSDNTIGFGTLSANAARYASGDTNGASGDTADAHTISVATNGASGYIVTVNGTTLTNGGLTITAIGGTAASSSVGTKQFGMRLIANSGTGTVSAPYNGANWALDTVAFPDQVASGSGDSVTSVFGARYIANITSGTDAGDYTTALTYLATATF